MLDTIDVVAAGHICLDIIPTFSADARPQDTQLLAGKLLHVGPAVMALGGSVANTGLALHRLGTTTSLMGKVGDDLFGQLILDILRRQNPALAEGMRVAVGEHSSYSVVISPRGVDRTFLHYPGANDTFGAGDVDFAQVRKARVFHFGYPPIMRQLYSDGGDECATLLHRVKEQGVTTSLDMALPDPSAEAGRVDWQAWLQRVLPAVDIFMPSVDEIVYMLKEETTAGRVDGPLLSRIAQRCLQWGAAIVALKLGDEGLYIRTTDDLVRLQRLGRGAPHGPQDWHARELLSTCFAVNVVGTTGAGDCTIAGFLMALLRGQSPEDTLASAVAVGACSVEQADATSGVPAWPAVQARIHEGWARRPADLALPGWHYNQQQGIRHGPSDTH